MGYGLSRIEEMLHERDKRIADLERQLEEQDATHAKILAIRTQQLATARVEALRGARWVVYTYGVESEAVDTRRLMLDKIDSLIAQAESGGDEEEGTE